MCIIRTLILSLLASAMVLVTSRIYLYDTIQENARAQALETAEGAESLASNYVAITFDDSPSKDTVELVELLDSMDVKASFFITGINIPGRENAIEHIYESGHDLGNHAWDYTGIGTKTARGAIENIVRTEGLVKQICGRATPFVRPPYNSISDEAYTALYEARYRIIYYDLDSRDFFDASKASVIARISCAEAGDIIRFHDGIISTRTLREVIIRLREMGLEPVALSTLLS